MTRDGKAIRSAAALDERGEAKLLDTLEHVEASFAAAVQSASRVVEASYRIGGHVVRLRSPNEPMLRKLTTSFTHLAEPADATPELTVELWDSAGGAPAPPTPEVGGESAPGAFFYFSDDRVRMGYQLGTSGDARVLTVYPHAPTPALSVLAIGRGRAWYWVADAERIPYWEQATPLVYLLHWWLREQDSHLLHAGAVGTDTGGVLLVGKSGSGKSTSTLSTLQSDELRYAGDDYVAVSLGGTPWVHGLYSAGKLMPNHVQRLPFLLAALANTDQLEVEKAVVYVHEQWPGHITPGFPLRAILAPRVLPGLREARVIETSRLAALAALAPSTVFQMHTRGQDSLVQMRRLAELVPSYVLELGSDMASIPEAILELLRRLEREQAA
jgi:hypothetical protein